MEPSTALAALRALLVRMGYHAPAHASLLGSNRGSPADRLAQSMEDTDDGTPISLALRLFTLGVPIQRDEATTLLGSDLTAQLLGRGVLLTDADSIRSAVAITFFGEIAAAQDFAPLRPEDEHEDLVTPVAGSTRILSLFTVPTPGGRGKALEIGTGQGLPITIAAASARLAIGTDISPRALRCAQMTAELNGRTNIEFRQGSLFDVLSAGSETFDTIISNPPFVITPGDSTAVPTAISGGGSMTEHVVRGCGRFLTEGGFATILGNWGCNSEHRWSDPVRRWVDGSGCDALVIQLRHESAMAYVRSWRRELRSLRPFREPTSVEAWLRTLAAMDVSGVSLGIIILRRRTGINWFHAVARSTAGAQAGAGNQLRRIFDARTALTQCASIEQLLARSAKLCPAVELAGKPSQRGRAEFILADGTLRQTEGWPEPILVDPLALSVLFGCDGRRPIRSVIATIAETNRTSATSLERSLGPLVQRWFELGYLY